MRKQQTATTRRSFVRGGLLASLAIVASLGALPLPDAAASKNNKKPKSIASRVRNQRELCDLENGTFDGPVAGPNGTRVTTCRGGDAGNRRCVNTPKTTACHMYFEQPDVSTQPLQPESPYADPSDGTDHTMDSDSPYADPSDGTDHSMEPESGEGPQT